MYVYIYIEQIKTMSEGNFRRRRYRIVSEGGFRRGRYQIEKRDRCWIHACFDAWYVSLAGKALSIRSLRWKVSASRHNMREREGARKDNRREREREDEREMV